MLIMYTISIMQRIITMHIDMRIRYAYIMIMHTIIMHIIIIIL